MRRRLGPIPALVALIAVLLPAGVFAATSVDSGRAGGDQQVRTAGFVQEGVAAGQPASQSTEPSGPTTTPPIPTTTTPKKVSSAATVPRAATATTARPGAAPGPAVTSTTTATLLPGLPLPALPALPILQPPVNSWSSSTNGVTAHLRMEPATPVPGQPVRFSLDVTAPGACCAMNLSYGDGVVSPNPAGTCDSPATRTATLTHTFPSPGDYELLLTVITFPCHSSMIDGVFVPPPLYATFIRTCITVGLRLLGQPACAPFNHFGPGTVYSAA